MRLISVLVFVLAQQAFAQPSDLIRLVRRNVTDATASQRYAAAGAAVQMIGMSSITGPEATWLLESHGSFGGIEELEKSLNAAAPDRALITQEDHILSPSSTLIAFYRPFLSYRPNEAVQMFPKARYIQAIVFHVQPGQESQFVSVVRSRKAGLDSVNIDRPDIAYQVISGDRSGMFLFLTPLATLKTIDEAIVKMQGIHGAIAERDVPHETLLFRIEPSMSYVSDEFAAGDSAFWRAKR